MKNLIACLLLTACALPAGARESINQQLDADPAGEVIIEVTSGTLKISGWDEARVSVEGTRDGRGDFAMERDGRVIQIEDHAHGTRSFSAESNLAIRVPRRSAVHVELISGDVEIRDLTGDIEVEAVSADIDLRADSSRISVESVSGSVTVRNAGTLARGSFESVSGDVSVETAIADDAELDLEAVTGEITLTFRGELNARVDVETGPGGDIRNDLSADKPERERYTGAESLSFKLGSGRADVEVSVVTGRVTLERK